MDAQPLDPAPPPPPPNGAYVYAASDSRPRQPREIDLCATAARFDWMYTSAMLLGGTASVYVSASVVKSSEEPGVRLIGPGLVGFFWGGFLSGAYLSLPKCDPLWTGGSPPEGNVRSDWPIAAAISLIATVTAPAIDYIFTVPTPVHWPIWERSSRVFIGMGAGLIGSLFPYVVSPRPWAAKLEIEKIRLGAVNGGPFVSYGLTF